MPNWTYNTVEITGSVEDIQNFIDLVKVTDAEGKDYYDFTQCNPVPDELRNIHQGNMNIDGVQCDAWYEDDDGTKRPMMDMIKDNLLEKYNVHTPLDWQYLYWGTKWGDCETWLMSDTITKDGRECVFHFNSAWGEPFRLLNDIAVKFNFEIRNEWMVEMDEGEGISEYPWTPEDTERIYANYEKSLFDVKNMIAEKIQ